MELKLWVSTHLTFLTEALKSDVWFFRHCLGW